jgi:digeranylgeranylglycerophospholipid reductase
MTRSIPERLDVLVVGAGPGGCCAAVVAARAGLEVAIVEAHRAEDVGSKVCGNAVCLDTLEPLEEHVAPPSGPEVSSTLKGVSVYLPGGVEGIEIDKPGVILNRPIFGQRLLADAVSEGALLVDRCRCVGWASRDTATVRLRPTDGEDQDVSARIVVDASGYRSVLTRSGGPSHADTLDRTQAGVGYREILALGEPLGEDRGGSIALRPRGASSGYAWIFPMGGRLANVGLGTTLADVEGSVKDAYDAFVSSRPELRGAEPVDSGAGMLPLRRPLVSLVGDSFLSVGDAGCMASPLHGGGIAPAMQAGMAAGEQAASALRAGASDVASLWEYNVRIANQIARYHAAHEVLRAFVLSLDDEDLRFLASESARLGAVGQMARGGSLLPSLAEGLRRLAAFSRRPRVAGRALRAALRIYAVSRSYGSYPASPEGLERWRKRSRSDR